jgi:predicted proteasome-type protease
MTYCCGILVRDGMVMIADTRTNAGLDNISTFRKLHVFRQPGDPYFHDLSERWSAALRAAHIAIPRPPYVTQR